MAKMPEDFNPSVGVMAKALKISKTTVIKYLAELKSRNIIRVIQQGGENVLTKYEFIKLEDWN
jgi:DNA-binding transcriptional regulator YhcF (GntR family)